jgi:HAD superfamily hydrolase (TIGR01509 family)
MDTLIRDPWEDAVREVTGIPPQESRPLRDRSAWADFELDLIDEQAYATRFFLPESGRRLDLAALKRSFARGYRYLEGMEQLLADAAGKLPVHILSNYPRWYDELRTQFHLDRFVTGHHPSYVVGVRKPAREYFQRVLARTGFAPHELLFVDDRLQNVEAARALGMPAALFTGAGDLRRLLEPILRRGAAESST